MTKHISNHSHLFEAENVKSRFENAATHPGDYRTKKLFLLHVATLNQHAIIWKNETCLKYCCYCEWWSWDILCKLICHCNRNWQKHTKSSNLTLHYRESKVFCEVKGCFVFEKERLQVAWWTAKCWRGAHSPSCHGKGMFSHKEGDADDTHVWGSYDSMATVKHVHNQ